MDVVKEQKRITISFRFGEEALYAKTIELAYRRRMKVSELIRTLIRQELEKEEKGDGDERA